ncbi:MAG: SGNH/GDSL hydrolase family protein [Actinobacteria bacterium]|nr:SGNH/GDSL hydrolase family protein [Actinomycetota bacterium]
MLIVSAVFAALIVVTLGVETQLALRGREVVAPDTKTLAASFAAESVDRHVKTLWMGDSTAAGVGASNPDGCLSSQVGSELLDTNAPHGYDMQVIAVSGARIGDVVDKQLPRVAAHKPDVVAISIGANDTIHLTRAATFRDRYKKLIDGLVRAGVSADHIVLIGVPDIGSPTRLMQPLRAIVGLRSRRLDREVRNVAKAKGVRYVDLFHATSKPFRANPSKYLADDKYHPSDAGYALWAKAVAPVVAKAAG